MMKKWTAALLACMMLCMCASGAMAASKCKNLTVDMSGYKIVTYEGFESYTDTEWLAYTGDDDDNDWYWLEYEGCDGDWVMASDSYIEWPVDEDNDGEIDVDEDGYEIWLWKELKPDNWLVTPKMNIELGDVFTFNAATYWDEKEHFCVYIDVTDDEFDFENAKLLSEYTLAPKMDDWNTYTVGDLSDYAGKTVRFAFRHVDTFGSSTLMLDCLHHWRLDPNVGKNLPQTGDDSNIALWIGLMAISFLGAAALSRKAKKAC